jgi:hypothetical protein
MADGSLRTAGVKIKNRATSVELVIRTKSKYFCVGRYFLAIYSVYTYFMRKLIWVYSKTIHHIGCMVKECINIENINILYRFNYRKNRNNKTGHFDFEKHNSESFQKSSR